MAMETECRAQTAASGADALVCADLGLNVFPFATGSGVHVELGAWPSRAQAPGCNHSCINTVLLRQL